jgi:hypothetical protein
MTSIYPLKLPGHMITHDPTKVEFKKISSNQYNKVLEGDFKQKQDLYLPRQREIEEVKVREGKSLSYSQSTFVNHFDKQIKEHFQPDWVKLDKQVLRFYGYFKESVEEYKKEHARIRKLVLCYYLVDDTVDISEEREVNSGIVQGSFLKRDKIRKLDGTFYKYNDFIVGNDLYIWGKYITIYDCDQYSREFFNGMGVSQPSRKDIPTDQFHYNVNNKFVPKKDNIMKDYLEHKLGGGKVAPAKQFLENDRKVLRFNAKYDNLKYIIHYYLADDTVEIREVHANNSGRDPFPLFLKRNKLPRKFSISQPGEIGSYDFYRDSDIEVILNPYFSLL